MSFECIERKIETGVYREIYLPGKFREKPHDANLIATYLRESTIFAHLKNILGERANYYFPVASLSDGRTLFFHTQRGELKDTNDQSVHINPMESRLLASLLLYSIMKPQRDLDVEQLLKPGRIESGQDVMEKRLLNAAMTQLRRKLDAFEPDLGLQLIPLVHYSFPYRFDYDAAGIGTLSGAAFNALASYVDPPEALSPELSLEIVQEEKNRLTEEAKSRGIATSSDEVIIYKAADRALVWNLDIRWITVNGHRMTTLTERENFLLQVLFQARGKTLNKQEIFDVDMDYVDLGQLEEISRGFYSNNINAIMSSLRKKIRTCLEIKSGNALRGLQLIEGVHSRGYRFNIEEAGVISG